MYQNQFAESFSVAEISVLNLYHRLKEKEMFKVTLKLSSKSFTSKKEGKKISHFSFLIKGRQLISLTPINTCVIQKMIDSV